MAPAHEPATETYGMDPSRADRTLLPLPGGEGWGEGDYSWFKGAMGAKKFGEFSPGTSGFRTCELTCTCAASALNTYCMPTRIPAQGFYGVRPQFVTTHWSVVLSAQGDTSSAATEALDNLCRTYWYPLYAYVRRRGYSPEDAQDLTQEFFARLVSQSPSGNSPYGRSQLATVDRQKGKFRSWLLGVMNHFLAHQWEKARAQKRGGGEVQFSFDSVSAEDRYRMEPADQCTPERLFERRWAFTVLDEAAARLRNEYREAGKEKVYGVLKEFVSHEADAMTYAKASQRLGLSEGGTKAAVHRLRQRYQEVIREEIAQTVTTATEVDDEIRYLLEVVRR